MLSQQINKNIKHYIPPVVWALFIFVLCTMSRNSIPFVEQSLKQVFDKLVHIILYLIFTALLIVAFIKQSNSYHLKHNSILYAILISASYGVFIEFYQATQTLNRTGDVLDIIANVCGSIIGLLGFYLVYGKAKNYM